MSVDLVTGGTGFIGRHLVSRLMREGRKVRILCRPGSERKLDTHASKGVELHFGDLGDEHSVRSAASGVNRVFHCGGHVSDWGTREEFHLLNVQATEWLLEAARAARVSRFVHFSSIAVFGTPSPPCFDDETSYGKGRDDYSLTKAQGERAALEAWSKYGLPVTVLRPAVVYGRGGTWLEEPLKMIKQGKMFLLGGGKGTCHPCYIENLMDAAVLVAADPRAIGQAYIVGDGDAITFREYFNAVASLLESGAKSKAIRKSIPLPIARGMAYGFETLARISRSRSRPLLTQTAIDMVTTRSQMSGEKIRRDLGFAPRYDFRAAIAELRGH